MNRWQRVGLGVLVVVAVFAVVLKLDDYALFVIGGLVVAAGLIVGALVSMARRAP